MEGIMVSVSWQTQGLLRGAQYWDTKDEDAGRSYMAGVQNPADRSQNPSVVWRQTECSDLCV
jgi:hypothetical protein